MQKCEYLMQRVQWMHLVIIVFTKGPMFLSSTALQRQTNITIIKTSPCVVLISSPPSGEDVRRIVRGWRACLVFFKWWMSGRVKVQGKCPKGIVPQKCPGIFWGKICPQECTGGMSGDPG